MIEPQHKGSSAGDRKMEKELETILTNMKDAGCEEKTLKTAELLFTEHDADAMNRLLRRCRCSLIEELHEGQRKVDRLDYLIRQTEKIRKAVKQ